MTTPRHRVGGTYRKRTLSSIFEKSALPGEVT